MIKVVVEKDRRDIRYIKHVGTLLFTFTFFFAGSCTLRSFTHFDHRNFSETRQRVSTIKNAPVDIFAGTLSV